MLIILAFQRHNHFLHHFNDTRRQKDFLHSKQHPKFNKETF